MDFLGVGWVAGTGGLGGRELGGWELGGWELEERMDGFHAGRIDS